MNLVQQSSDNLLVSQSPIQSGGLAGQSPQSDLRAQPFPRAYQPLDGVAPQGWATTAGSGTPFSANALPGLGGTAWGSGSAQGGFLGLINNLISQLGALINQYSGETNAEGAGTQTVGDGTFSSTGDPHLSQTGNVLDGSGKASPVSRHFDSMTSHDNLLSSQDFDGGYRLSTSVTPANAKGLTLNASATVHANSDLDTITLRNDGTFSIASNGSSVPVAAGQSVTLLGGEQVTCNTDGSLSVLEQDAFGGSIATTMTARGGGVDVTAAVHNATVGGDIASGSLDPALAHGSVQVPTLVRNPQASAFA